MEGETPIPIKHSQGLGPHPSRSATLNVFDGLLLLSSTPIPEGPGSVPALPSSSLWVRYNHLLVLSTPHRRVHPSEREDLVPECTFRPRPVSQTEWLQESWDWL